MSIRSKLSHRTAGPGSSTFSQSYTEARARFREAATASGGHLETLLVLEDPDRGELTIDVAIYGSSNRNTLVVTSGVHGIEGFAGSAIQLDFMLRGVPDGMRVILAHAVNPYGMALCRRANEHNVDLNRNVLPRGTPYAGASAGYRALYELLHPSTPYVRLDGFLLRAAMQIIRQGMPALRQAVAGGQYDYPNGLFWGGRELEQGPRLLLSRLSDWMRGAHRAVLLDLHTGLGRRGTYTLLVDAEPGGETLARYRTTYGPQIQSLGASSGVAYRFAGAITEGIRRDFSGDVDAITQEFGTCSPLTVIGALRAENRAHFWGGDVQHAKRLLREAFYPSSSTWRRRVLAGGRAVLARVVQHLQTE